MSDPERKEVLQAGPYGRAQFLKDAAWLSLDPEEAFSRAVLRRQRDHLMHIHHPDRGGSKEMAARINVTYSRMLVWLNRRLDSRKYLQMRRETVLAEHAKNAQPSPDHIGQRSDAALLCISIVGIAVAAVGIGLDSLARNRR